MEQQIAGQLQDLDALPQPLGDYRAVDLWQAHINYLFYRLRGKQLHAYSQTFASGDFRLGHALAIDYYEKALQRDGVAAKGSLKQANSSQPAAIPLTIMEWGPGNGNLAACFLTHLRTLDEEGRLYPRVRYLLIDSHPETLDAARAHPDLSSHLNQIEVLCADVQQLQSVRDHSVDRIFCNELWNDLPTKLLVKKDGEVEEEHLRPNLSEEKTAAISNWSEFIRLFADKDVRALQAFPPFFDDIIWEKEYHKIEWKDVLFRKTISEFLKLIDEQVLVPVNLGASATIREAKRLLAPDAIGFSSFDAGTSDMAVLNDPEKPCYGQFGGQYSFMVNFALLGMVAKHLNVSAVMTEPQREFVGSRLCTNVITLMDLLACHPLAGTKAEPWQLDRLTIRTIHALNAVYESPYERTLDFPLRSEMPSQERDALQATLASLKRQGVPDTVAYLTEEELLRAQSELQDIGYDRESIQMVLGAPPAPIDYCHFFFRP
ncbi:SAM-dependent methyltransferase [Nitrospira sp. Nam80]